MTTLRKIESNRENALKSTGPRSQHGKQRSSQNARRHGLTAETVVHPYEDGEEYAAFEQSIAADYDAISAVERALVRRVAGLLWRLRRAAIIETGLLQGNDGSAPSSGEPDPVEINIDGCSTGRIGAKTCTECNRPQSIQPCPSRDSSLDISQCFSRLLARNSGAFELLGRYEGSLWRQLRQALYTLERIKRLSIEPRRRSRFSWDFERRESLEMESGLPRLSGLRD
jgi:hypothetical protein